MENKIIKIIKKRNSNQLIGIGIFIVAFVSSFLSNSLFFNLILGVLCSVGIGLVLKWIPFRKTK